MKGRRRWWWAVGLIALASVAVEVGVRLNARPRANLMIINAYPAAVRDVTASYGAVKTPLGDLASGGSTLVRLENGPRDDVSVEFRQDDNPSAGFLLGAEELDQARRDGLRMVITIKPNEIIRFLEEAPVSDDPSLIVRFVRGVFDRMTMETRGIMRKL